jgi:hypothetical protein
MVFDTGLHNDLVKVKYIYVHASRYTVFFIFCKQGEYRRERVTLYPAFQQLLGMERIIV